jgi:hypothetical protein
MLWDAQFDHLEHDERYQIASIFTLAPEFLWVAQTPVAIATPVFSKMKSNNSTSDTELGEVNIEKCLRFSFVESAIILVTRGTYAWAFTANLFIDSFHSLLAAYGA